MTDLKQKTIIITGAGSGIGAATAQLMASRGANVVALDLNGKKVHSVAQEMKDAEGQVISMEVDVGNEQQMKEAINTVKKEFRTIDVLINNAALQVMGPLHECSEADFDRMVHVNLKGVFNGCKHVLPTMMEQNFGSIITVSSVLGLVGDANLSVYGATKGAVLAMTQSIAVAYGEYGIRANCICPGDVQTPMVREFFDYQEDPERARAEVYGQYPMQRIAEPEEVAKVMAFLASSESSFISGTSLRIDGGLLSKVY